jgi:phosphatidylserine decarboxylase precursor
MGDNADKVHYLIRHSPGDILRSDEEFITWLTGFFRSFGFFLDTTLSAAELDTFINDPNYHIDEYDPGPSGWLTFNQFFTRNVKPGKRPVKAIGTNNIIVSPCDGIYLGCWSINESSVISPKGVQYSIMDLLEGSPYKEKFAGGFFTHSYLDTTDYHRYHVPVAGEVKEVRKIPGSVVVNTIKAADGEFETTTEVGFQFSQTRGLVILESSIGLVALLPIGMGHVSSVNLSVDPGTVLAKGEGFGYFAYGGSDLVMLFEKNKIGFTAEQGKHYKQGEKIAISL